MVSIFLGISAGLIQVVAYFDYLRRVLRNTIKPHAASWSIWAFGAVLESLSYIFVSGDWVKDILPIACAICAISIFLICIKRGHFQKLTRFEYFLVVTDCIILIIWMLTQSPIIANILFVLTGVVSFIPILNHVIKDPKAEHALPWVLWSIAYFLMTLTILLRWEKWEDLIYPTTFLVLHVLVALLSSDWGAKKINLHY